MQTSNDPYSPDELLCRRAMTRTAQASYYADQQRPEQPRRASMQTSNDPYSPDELLRRRATTRTAQTSYYADEQ